MKWQVNTIEEKHISKQNNKRLRLKNFFNLLLFQLSRVQTIAPLNGLLRHTKMPERQQQMVWYRTCQQTCGTLCCGAAEHAQTSHVFLEWPSTH